METKYQVVHEPEKQQFVIYTDQGEAVQLYEWEKQDIAITHTEVPVDLEGQGLGSALAEYALEYTEQQGLKLKPYCLFMEEYILNHAPQYKHLIADDFDPEAKINEQ